MIASPETITPERLLRQLEWRVIRRLDGLLQGDYRTLFYGTGTDFADLREYEPRDDIRHIDWNVTARMNSPYVRQYVEERDMTAWFLLDLSPSMGFGPAERSKSRVLTDVVATLARLLTRSGNRVGAMLYSDRVEQTIPPRSGRIQVLRLVRELLKEHPVPNGPTTDLGLLLNSAANTLKRRSLVFLLSDFLSEAGWERPLARLNQRHELVTIRLTDPRENALPDAGMVVVEDAETGEQLFVDTSDPLFRQRFQAAAAEREARLTQMTGRAGVALFTISTEEDVVQALAQIATLHKQRRL